MTNGWNAFPMYKPAQKGRYLVTYRRPTAGKWVVIRFWDGEAWERNDDIVAWMRLPERYKTNGKR